jgi:hypothetical protein
MIRSRFVVVFAVLGCGSSGGDGSASGESGDATTVGVTMSATAADASSSSTAPDPDGSSGAPTSSDDASSSSTGDAPKFDLGVGPDLPDVGRECPEDSFMAQDDNLCAAAPVIYNREAGVLTLSITGGLPYTLTQPDVELIFATDQPGYEGFFTIMRETSAPDVFYMTIADDDFIDIAHEDTCGVTSGSCETECIDRVGGGPCRAFVDDFIPIVAGAFVGAPLQLVTFERRSSPAGACCAIDFSCSASVSSYTEHVVSGPAGTMHFIFQDGHAFLDTMGWSYVPGQFVSGDALFELDLCSLPVPAG